MNTYLLNYKKDVEDGNASVSNFLSAVTIGSVLSPNFKVIQDADGIASFSFDLPFSLSNLNVEAIAYDSRFQDVKEFLDKPYAIAGRVVSLIRERGVSGAYDFQKDFDDFIMYQNVYLFNEGDPTANYADLFIGIVNSTLTGTYAPFGAVNGNLGVGIEALKIYDSKDFVKALAQANCSKAGSLAGVSMTASLPNYQSPPFNPGQLSSSLARKESFSATLNSYK